MIGKVVEKSGVAWYNGFIKADNLPDKSEFEKVSKWDTMIQDTMEEYDNVER